jgi:phage repressor protein C with HTH and peptisase S24 domain
MSHPRSWDAVLSPTVDSGGGRAQQPSNSGSAAECLDDVVCVGVHDAILRYSQPKRNRKSCDNRLCDIRTHADNGGMTADEILEAMRDLDISQKDLARCLGLSSDKMSKVLHGKRQLQADEALTLQRLLDRVITVTPDTPSDEAERDYLKVAILPSFAGAGGGGTGDGDLEYGMVPRRLIEHELRARPSDLLLIEVRGDSMAPEFLHGDQILIDRRDRNPVQPGPFALFDGDAYVIKLVERIPQRKGWYRVFSVNDRYSPYEVEEGEQTIMGRPVWFGRRL